MSNLLTDLEVFCLFFLHLFCFSSLFSCLARSVSPWCVEFCCRFSLDSLLSLRFRIFISRFFDRLIQFRFDTTPWGRELAFGTKFTWCCISIVPLYVYIYNYMRRHNQLILTTSITNDNTSLQKYKFLTLYFRKGDVLLCVRDEWRQVRTAILTQVLLLTIAALLPHLGQWLLNQGVVEGRSPQSASWFSVIPLSTGDGRGHPVYILS